MLSHTAVVAYDVSDDDRRLRIARICAGFGRRVQYSVFEAVLDDLRHDRMLRALELQLDVSTDRLHVYRLCPACTRTIHFVGRLLGTDDPALRTRHRIV